MSSVKNYLSALVPVLILATGFALQASAGTIGVTTTDWNNWQETAGLPAARYSMAAGVLHGAIGFRQYANLLAYSRAIRYEYTMVN